MMSNAENKPGFNRRDVLKTLGVGTTAGLLGLISKPASAAAWEEEKAKNTYAKGMAPVTITKVRAIGTAPSGSNLVIVKVETSEPGLYGVGCATFTQRAEVVVTAINRYLDDFCKGRDVDNIEDMWQAAYTSSYWRNGPDLNNALSGLNEAMWDIKGKRAGMPVYQLLGGKARFAVDTYAHADGRDVAQVIDQVKKFQADGFRHVRIQLGGYGSTNLAKQPDYREANFGKASDQFMDPRAYVQAIPKLFNEVRKACGEDVELLHDVHERVQPMDIINMCKRLEEYDPFFVEDPLSPENRSWWKQLRASTTVPFAMGELFNNPNEFVQEMADHSFDFIRCHVSQMGGITPIMKIAHLGELFNVRSAWHGPGDCSPIGHAAHCHIDLNIWNFGIQESVFFNEKDKAVFPGCPELKKGYLYVNEAPGLGIDIDEKEAAKYPINNRAGNWTVRKRDGTIIRP